jgi:hypothetical protein
MWKFCQRCSMWRLLLTSILSTTVLSAQGGPASHVVSGSYLPAHCSAKSGDIWYLTSGATGILYTCTATNTWTAAGTGGGGLTTNGTTGQALTSNGSGGFGTPVTLSYQAPLTAYSTISDLSGYPSTFPPPSPGVSTKGGVQSHDCTGTGHLLSINTDGTTTCSADSGGGGTSAGANHAMQCSNGAGGFVDCGCTATSGDASCNSIALTAGGQDLHIRTSCFDLGADNASADLVDADIGPQGRIFMVPLTATVTEVTVSANAGTPNVIVQRNHAGTAADLTSAALATASVGGIACSKTTAVAGLDTVTTCSATLQNTALAAGDWIQTKTGSGFASSGAKRLGVCVTYTVTP